MRELIANEYFEWLLNLVGYYHRYNKETSHRKVLVYLHNTEFTYVSSIPRDENRAEDGVRLRYRFGDEAGYSDPIICDCLDYLPCSVLEMMVALALRCEETIMDDPHIGDRTGQWFWTMMGNLGLGMMSDSRYDQEYVTDTVERFLNREYEPDGRGGLFRIRDCDRDLRNVEIWYQLCWYLDRIT